MVTKKRVVGIKRKTAKFRKRFKPKVRPSVKLTKSKKHHKKRKHNTKRRFRLKGGDGDDSDECPICGEEFKADDETITTNCGHKFHKNELVEWCRRKPFGMCTCPMDRINISEEMEQFMPQNENDSDSDSNSESTFDADIDTLENFMGETATLLHNMPYLPLPEAPYLDGLDLPASVEGGPREKLKNMLICLFANDDYFYNNLHFLNGCNIIDMIDDEDEEGVTRLKIALITLLMNLLNNNRNYSDDQLRQLIKNFLERCAANVLLITITPLPNINI